MRIILALVNKMSITALQCKTIRQFVNTANNINNGGINFIIAETDKTFPSLILILRIFIQCFKFYKSFQLFCSCICLLTLFMQLTFPKYSTFYKSLAHANWDETQTKAMSIGYNPVLYSVICSFLFFLINC